MSALFDATELEVKDEREDLPPIDGTPRQTGWASAVRARKLREIDGRYQELRRLAETYEAAGNPKATAAREKLRAWLDRIGDLEKQVKASFWLNRRDNTADELLAGAAAKPGHTFVPEGS